jgi:hypothetical protein
MALLTPLSSHHACIHTRLAPLLLYHLPLPGNVALREGPLYECFSPLPVLMRARAQTVRHRSRGGTSSNGVGGGNFCGARRFRHRKKKKHRKRVLLRVHAWNEHIAELLGMYTWGGRWLYSKRLVLEEPICFRHVKQCGCYPERARTQAVVTE